MEKLLELLKEYAAAEPMARRETLATKINIEVARQLDKYEMRREEVRSFGRPAVAYGLYFKGEMNMRYYRATEDLAWWEAATRKLITAPYLPEYITDIGACLSLAAELSLEAGQFFALRHSPDGQWLCDFTLDDKCPSFETPELAVLHMLASAKVSYALRD